jgi:hypothetical protein
MKSSIKVVDAGKLQRLLKSQGKAFATEGQRLLKMQARALCIEYGRQTDPPDAFGDGIVEKFKNRIEKETRYIFPTRSDYSKVFELIKQRDPALANAYYFAAKSGRIGEADDLRRKAGLPQGGGNIAALRAARTGKRGSIPARAHPPVSLLRDSESRKLARGPQNNVGVAKAGWYQAATGLGSRVRRTATTDAGTQTSLTLFPKYVRAVSRRVGGLGGATVGEGRIVIYSNVRYATEALNDRRKATAESDANTRILKAVRIMLSKISEKFNRNQAA